MMFNILNNLVEHMNFIRSKLKNPVLKPKYHVYMIFRL